MLVNIFGKRGAGKTVLIKNALKNCRGPVVVIDILGNFQNIEDTIKAKSLGDAVSFVRDYRGAQDRGDNMDEIAKVIILDAHDPDETVDYVSSALWHAEGGTLVLDEADGFTPDSAAPRFDYLVRYGRNKGIDLLTGCRRPAEISRNITAGANRMFIFQTQEPRDIDYYKKTILGERAESLISMPDYHGIYLDYDKKSIGTFKTNSAGEVFILSAEKIK